MAKRGTFEWKQNISKARQKRNVVFKCDYCGESNKERPSHYKKSKRHFCDKYCYAKYRKEKMEFYEQPAYKGIRKLNETKQIYHRNYCKNHPENISHLKARQYARKRNAKGGHTLQEWEKLKEKHKYRCAKCNQRKPLTKDHIIPLSENGTDYISNIQPLCRNCNSQKWKKI